jgi:integrase
MRKKKASSYGRGYSVYPNARGGFVGSVEIQASPRRHKTKTFATAEDAEQWCREQVGLLRDKKIDIRKGAQPLTDFATTWYNEVACEKDLKEKTLENYRKRLEYYILPYLGTRHLDAIRPEDIQRWMNKLRAEGMAQSTIRDLFNLLKQILKVAKIWKYIAENPCDEIAAPRVKRVEKEPFTIAELLAVLQAASGIRNEAAFWCVSLLGMRLGELMGLRWSDLDFDKAELRIAQQVQNLSEDYEDEDGKRRTRHYVAIVDSTKTDAGGRLVPLPAVLVEVLRGHLVRQLEERVYLGKRWTDHDLIFASEVGTPISPRNFEVVWYRVRALAGIPHGRNLHLFRHTANSLMVDMGILDAVRADIFGWSKKGIIGHYSHPSPAAKRAAVDALARAILEAMERREETG